MSTKTLVRLRAIRTAYLIDAECFSASYVLTEPLIDGFISHANSVWGGHCDRLIYAPLQTELPSSDILAIKRYDPDRIHVLGTVGDPVLKQFDRDLSIWEVTEEETLGPERLKIYLGQAAPELLISAPATPVAPTRANLNKAQGDRLLMFGFSADCPVAYRRFLHRNFGTFGQWIDNLGTIRRDLGLENLMQEIETLQYEVKDATTFISALREMAAKSFVRFLGRPYYFVAPCELPSLRLNAPLYSAWIASTYRVVIGKMPEDFVLFWNLCAEMDAWKRPYQHFLWLDPDLLQDSEIVPPLAAWIQAQIDSYGSKRDVELLSRSLSNSYLEQVQGTLRNAGCRSFIRVGSPDDLLKQLDASWEQRRRHRRPLSVLNRSNARRFMLSGPDETIFLGDAEPFPRQSGHVSCAVDVQIERGAQSGFWALPLRHSESLMSVIFPRALSRVSDDWLFAAELNQSRIGEQTQKAPELQITIPRDFDVIRSLLREPVAVGRGGWELRARLVKERSAIDVEISPEGRQLRELVTLIDGLWRANIYFGKRLWRDVFTKMAGRDARQDENLRTEVTNTIWKGFESALPAGDLERIVPPTAESVLRRVGNRLPGRYVLVCDLRERCEAEQRRYEQLEGDAQQRIEYQDGEITVSADRPRPLSIEDLQAGIDDLIALNFFRPGLVQKCSHCGESAFYHVDDLRQELICRGCGRANSLGIWSDWALSLNSLAQRCISGGSLSVALALSQIEKRPSSFSSFFWAPSLLIHHAQNGHGWREIDFACVTGGEFWIGEVKSGRVTASQIQRFGDVAEVIQPDRAAIYVEHDQIDNSVRELVEQMRTRLNPLGVKAYLHALPIF